MESYKTLTEKQHRSRNLPECKNSEDDASGVTVRRRRKVGRKPKRRRTLTAIEPVSLSLDRNDEKTILGILKRKLISERKLICETCGTVRKSAIGFLSHLHSCGKSPEECAQLRKPCEVCGRLMLSSSLQTHMYTVHKKLQEPPPKEIVCDVTTKRQAAVKAAELMQQFMEGESELNEGGSSTNNEFYSELPAPKLNNRHIGYLKRILRENGTASCRYPGCKFHTSTLEAMLDHLEICANKHKQVYACKMCSFHTEEKSNILNHIEDEHSYTQCSADESDDSDSMSVSLEEEEEEEEDLPGTTSKSILPHEKNITEKKVGCMCRKRSSSSNSIRPCLSALKWTLKYQEQHYEQYLFPSLHTKLTDWVELSEKEAQEYLPEAKESMFFALHNHTISEENLQSTSTRYKKLALFEGDVLSGNPIFFTGGPVWALAWCPLPLRWTIETYGKINQFIAVSCHKNMESTYCMGESYVHKGLIQIWNLGHLDIKSEGNVPVFEMGIAHEYGTVWCMEWCPSGCYDMQGKNDGTMLRIGLLAAACSDGSVQVYSVCDPAHLRSLKKNNTIFKPQPVVSLLLENKLCAEYQTWQCLCITWHAGKQHRIIAGGFTNGLIAVWRMDFEKQLLKLHEGQTRVILPYKVIQTNTGAVTAVVFSLGQDPRYLLTESLEHTIKFWDLEESHSPLFINKKGNVATYNLQLIDWMNGHSCSSLHSFRGFGADVNSIVTQNSNLGALAANPWINAVAEATETGEFSVAFVHQLLHHTDADKSKKSRRMMINHIGLSELRKYDVYDQHILDLNNSFSLNNNKGLKENLLDFGCKEDVMSKICFRTTAYENSLMLQGRTKEHEFGIEFILGEDNAALAERLRRDALEIHSVNNTADRGQNDFDSEAVINNVQLYLHSQNSESEMNDSRSPCANTCTGKIANEDDMVESYGYNTHYNHYDKKKWAEREIIPHDNISPNERNILFPTDCFKQSSSQVTHVRHVLEKLINKDHISNNNRLSKDTFSDVSDISNARVNEDDELLTSEQDIKVIVKENYTKINQMSTSVYNKIVQDCSFTCCAKHFCLGLQEKGHKGDSADTSSDLCNIVSTQSHKSMKQESAISGSVVQQDLTQPGTDRQAATSKSVKNNSVSHSKDVCKMFNTSISLEDTNKESSSAADLVQHIPTSQKNKNCSVRFTDIQQLTLETSRECNKLLHNKSDGSERPVGPVSGTDIAFTQKIDLESAINNQTGESDDFCMSVESSADTHKLRCSKPEAETYEDFSSSYGVIFCDFPKNNISEPATEDSTWTCQSDMLRPSESTAYPILSINRAAWNPNCRSFLWLAAGYQCGFVRTSCVSAVHNHMMDDIFRKAAWDMNRKEKQKRAQF